MKILIVNDDSVSAPGIAMLARAAAQIAEVWVVAPAQECSAMSQKLTLRELLTVEKVADFPADVAGVYRVGGTPVDCVKVALTYILKEMPDVVLSGINNGYNAGYDISYSGTLGAAFEAARNGIPAIAFSVAGNPHLETAEPYLLPILQELLEKKADPGMVWNVNLPVMKDGAPKGILYGRTVAPVSMYQETYEEIMQPDGTIALQCKGYPTPNDRIPEGTDADALRKGYISIGQARYAAR